MGNQTELNNQLREILDPPATNPLADDFETKLRMLEKFINNRYVPKATHDKKVNGYKHRELKAKVGSPQQDTSGPLASTEADKIATPNQKEK